MAGNKTEFATTTLTVRLPVRLMGRLYTLVAEQDRDVSAIVAASIASWIDQAQRSAPSAKVTPPKAAAPAPSVPAGKTPAPSASLPKVASVGAPAGPPKVKAASGGPQAGTDETPPKTGRTLRFGRRAKQKGSA